MRWRLWLGTALVGWLCWAPAAAQVGDEPLEPGGGPAESVSALLEIERTMLEQDQSRYEELAGRRSVAVSRLGRLYPMLDGAVREGKALTGERLQQLMDQVELAEEERIGLLAAERMVVDRISERLRRITLLEEQLATIEGRSREEVEGRLTGAWDLVLMPIEQRGTCVLRQSGALVSGTYRLEGGLSGSLQGTLVNRKVFLVRIDSKLGKSMEFEGYLSGDGTTIRGTWLNYELAGLEGSTGQWVANRRSDDR